MFDTGGEAITELRALCDNGMLKEPSAGRLQGYLQSANGLLLETLSIGLRPVSEAQYWRRKRDYRHNSPDQAQSPSLYKTSTMSTRMWWGLLRSARLLGSHLHKAMSTGVRAPQMSIALLRPMRSLQGGLQMGLRSSRLPRIMWYREFSFISAA